MFTNDLDWDTWVPGVRVICDWAVDTAYIVGVTGISTGSNLSACSTLGSCAVLPAAAVGSHLVCVVPGNCCSFLIPVTFNWARTPGSSLVICPITESTLTSIGVHHLRHKNIPKPMYTRCRLHLSSSLSCCISTACNAHHILLSFRWMQVWVPVAILKEYMHKISPLLLSLTNVSQLSRLNVFDCK